MKKLLTASVFALGLFAITAAAAEMTGWITDEKCKHTNAAGADCARKCVQAGVPAVFINTADNKVYKIANQDKVVPHVGHKVTVTGEVDDDTLTVATVKVADSGTD